MRINYNTLNGFYLTKKGTLIKGSHVYILKNSCKNCGNPYLTLRLRPSDYCCLSCNQTGKSRHFTEKHRKNLSIALTGKHPSKETLLKKSKSMMGKNVGEKSYMFGKAKSPEIRKKISISQLERYKNIPVQDRPNFIHGMSNDKAYRSMLQNKREARKQKQSPQLTEIEEKKVLALYKACNNMNNGKCLYQIDHIRPISKGGKHYLDNLQILPRNLNQEKYNKYPLTEKEKIKYKGIRCSEILF